MLLNIVVLSAKMGRKQVFTSHDLLTIIVELKAMGIEGSYLQNCYDYGSRGIVLRLSTRTDEGRNKMNLLLESAKRLHTLEEFTAIRGSPSSFCGKLRKHLKERKLIKIEMVNGDRVVDFVFGSEDEGGFHLILELYASGNIILTDHTDKIMMILHAHVYDETNKVKMYNQYPRKEATIDPIKYEVTKEQLEEFLIKQQNEMSKGILWRRLLISSPLSVFGPVLIDHSLATVGINRNAKFNKDTLFPPLDDLIDNIKLIHTTPGTVPLIILGENGYDSFVPCQYAHLEVNSDAMIPFSSFDLAVREYFAKTEKIPVIEKDNSKTTIQKEEIKTGRIEKQLEEIIINKEHKVEEIDTLENKITLLEIFIDGYNTNISEEELPFKIISRDPVKKLVTIDLGSGFHVIVDPSQSAYANYGHLHQERKKLEYKQQKTIEAQEKITKAPKLEKKKEIDTSSLIEKRDHWFEKYNWFFTSDGLLVVTGKTAQQNEELVKRYLEDHDIYFHSDVAGSGSGIIKSEGKEIPPSSLEEAGSFVICHTKAWETGVPDKSWWVHSSQVSKTTQSGEYVTMGSFIIRGKKNYLSLAKMELCLTFLFKNVGIERLSTNGTETLEYAVPMVAPYSSVKGYGAKLIPGNIKAGKAIKQILDGFHKLVSQLEWEAIKRIPLDDIHRVMVTKIKWSINPN